MEPTVTISAAERACNVTLAGGLVIGSLASFLAQFDGWHNALISMVLCGATGVILGLIQRKLLLKAAGAIAILFALCPTAAQAGNCHQFFYPQQVVAVPVIAAPVYYQAGRDIEAEALAEKVARLAAPKIIEQIRSMPGNALKASAAEKSGGGSAIAQSALAQHCAKCHSGAAPKANAVFDGTTHIRCEQVIAALKSIRDGSMPKDHQVPADVKGQLMEELLALSGQSDPVAE